jgi:hypothetical protein
MLKVDDIGVIDVTYVIDGDRPLQLTVKGNVDYYEANGEAPCKNVDEGVDNDVGVKVNVDRWFALMPWKVSWILVEKRFGLNFQHISLHESQGQSHINCSWFMQNDCSLNIRIKALHKLANKENIIQGFVKY